MCFIECKQSTPFVWSTLALQKTAAMFSEILKIFSVCKDFVKLALSTYQCVIFMAVIFFFNDNGTNISVLAKSALKG